MLLFFQFFKQFFNLKKINFRLKPDVDATCEFMEFSSQFFNAMNLQESDAEGLDEETGSKVLKEISTYMRDVAMPSGKELL